MAALGRLSVIVFSGDYDRVHYALGLAGAAAATGRPAGLFFTMAALRALEAAGAGDVPGWAGLAPSSDGTTPAERDLAHAEAGIATIEELIAACVELGVEFMACDMGLRAMRMTAAELRGDVPVREGGMVTFLAGLSGDGAALFV